LEFLQLVVAAADLVLQGQAGALVAAAETPTRREALELLGKVLRAETEAEPTASARFAQAEEEALRLPGSLLFLIL
jgi:hypothetical protein